VLRIDRNRAPVPAIFSDRKINKARREAKAFFKLKRAERRQRRFRVSDVIGSPEIVQALTNLFSSRCAFCETPIPLPSASNVCHYRPTEGALGSAGKVDADHYWWTAYEWSNIYLACTECMRFKGHRFPVAGGRRASQRGGQKSLAREKPLLLDPCNDDPVRYLVFSHKGRVASSNRRGRATIEILGLNRSSLLSQRAQRAGVVHRALNDAEKKLRGATTENDVTAVEKLLADIASVTEPFAGMAQYLLATWLQRLPAKLTRLLEQGPETSFDEIRRRSSDVASAKTQIETAKEFEAYELEQQTYSLRNTGSEKHAARYYSKARLIDRIEIENFRGIQKLDLDIASLETERGPWTMFLGENGTGKSSILQAVALALTSDRERSTLSVTAADVLRSGATSGLVRVWLSGDPLPIELKFTQNGFDRSVSDPVVLLLGYGSTRLLPRGGSAKQRGDNLSRVRNLFNPFLALQDANAWFGSLDSTTFNTAAASLKDLLLFDEKVQISKSGDKTYVTRFGAAVPFAHLSDGHQSMLALGVDIMHTMMERWPEMKFAEGIVLIDELESHLHPSWKMQIVSSLRRTFPRVQFLATTHDPLCLRGLEAGEVVVMRRSPRGETVAVSDLPSVKGLRVEQLLTSEHFGLNSTMEPETERDFRDYYELLSAPKLSAAEKKRRDELKEKLLQQSVLGATPRDRMILAAVDQYIADERLTLKADDRLKLNDETKKEIQRIWSEVIA
jgi:uncharacterized protein (TIGR02646 family)